MTSSAESLLSLDPAMSGAADERLVWVVDDDDVRESLSFAFQLRYKTAAFPSALAFLSRADLDRPGCLVIADDMAQTASGSIQDELARLRSPVSVIFLTKETDLRTAVKYLQMGAVSVLEKPVDPEELDHAVDLGLERSILRDRRYRLERLFETLSRRERQIFVLVCQGLRNGDIAELLNLSQRTVEVHRAHISRKLGNASPIRLLYELTQTLGGNIISAEFDGLDPQKLANAISAGEAS